MASVLTGAARRRATTVAGLHRALVDLDDHLLSCQSCRLQFPPADAFRTCTTAGRLAANVARRWRDAAADHSPIAQLEMVIDHTPAGDRRR